LKKVFTFRHVICLLIAAFLLSTFWFGDRNLAKAATQISISSPYLTISVNPGGAYTLVSQTPSWTFGGKVGRTLTNLAVNSGSDNIGSYQEIDFNYVDKNAASRGCDRSL